MVAAKAGVYSLSRPVGEPLHPPERAHAGGPARLCKANTRC